MIKPAFVYMWMVFGLCASITRVTAQEIYREQVRVHTDAKIYHAGERIWFALIVNNPVSSNLSRLSRIAYVQLVDSAGVTISKAIVEVKNGKADGNMEIPVTARSATYSLVAFTRWMLNLSQPKLFVTPITIVNGYIKSTALHLIPPQAAVGTANLNLSISTDKDRYPHRSAVTMEISALEDTTMPVEFTISVRLATVNNLHTEETPPKENNENESSFNYRFSPELSGRWITGKVYRGTERSPQVKRPVYAIVPGYAAGFYNGITDSSGNFAIRMNEVIAADSLIVMTNPLEDSTSMIEVDDPFLKPRDIIPYIISPREENVERIDLNTLRNIVEVQRAYPMVTNFSQADVTRDTMPFFGKQDLLYKLDDYTRFPTMEEVFREYVQFVSVNRRGKKVQLSVYNEPYGRLLENNPLVLIDGYPVFDMNRLFSFDPLRVEQVHVVTRRYLRASQVFDGIVSLVTYSRNMNGFAIDKNALLLNDQLAQKRLEFSAPVYSGVERGNRLPDFRSLLLWKPGVNATNGKYKIVFYTSDVQGKYLISVYAHTPDGKEGRALKTIEVNGEAP